jgi:lipoprotein-releasing system ATP-binding protein
VFELFRRFNREYGCAVLVVTHNPELANLMPRRLRMVDAGQLVDVAADVPYRSSERTAAVAAPTTEEASA